MLILPLLAAVLQQGSMSAAPRASPIAGLEITPRGGLGAAFPRPPSSGRATKCRCASRPRRWTRRRGRSSGACPRGDGVYNLAATRDGRLLLATNKRARSVSLFETGSGRELARVSTSRRLPSGVAVSPDDRWAFVTCEGVGAEPGAVDVIDLRAKARVATVDVGQQAGGIDVVRVGPAR